MPKIIKTKVQKDEKHIVTYIKSSLKGFVVSFVLVLLLAVLYIKNIKFGDLATCILIYISFAVGGLITGYYSHKKVGGKGFVNGIIGGLLYSLIMVGFILIIVRFSFSFNLLILISISVISSIIGGILSANKN